MSGLGTRTAAGLGHVANVGSLAKIFADHVAAPCPGFLAAIEPIEKAGCIPGVMDMARVTLESAEDEKKYGRLKGDPLSIDETAFVMKYTAEDTKPPLYGDMNAKAYLPNRDLIEPYGLFMASLVKSMSKMEPFPDGTVTRGVKGDLRACYPVGRKVTWHGLVSCTKYALQRCMYTFVSACQTWVPLQLMHRTGRSRC